MEKQAASKPTSSSMASSRELPCPGLLEQDLLEDPVAVGLGLGEQERAEAPLALDAAADHGDLARLQRERRGQLAERVFLLAVLHHELLRREGAYASLYAAQFSGAATDLDAVVGVAPPSRTPR